MIMRYQSASAEIELSKKTALRYAGQGMGLPSEEVARLFFSCLDEFLACAAYRAASLELELTQEGNEIRLGPLCVKSESFSAHLTGCDRAILFCATVGGELDRLLLRYGRTKPSRALMLDAIGSAAIEAWCDRLATSWESRAAALRPRFSPGYGDFPIEHQKALLSLLCAAQTVGVSATESHMLAPQKSVTAVVGLKGIAT